MKNYTISIKHKKTEHKFEIADHPHHNGNHCKYRVYQKGVLMATFQPDERLFIHLCHNTGGLDEQLLHLLAAQIEAQLPHPPAKYLDTIQQ